MSAFENMETEILNLSDITPDPKNTRIHDDHNITVIKNSLNKFGQYRPFVVQKQGMIIRVGNGMYKAMKDLGWTQAACVVKELSDDEAAALSIVDNKSSDLSVFDDKMLADVLKGMDDDSLNLTGFVSVELDSLFEGMDGTIPDVDDSDQKDKGKSKDDSNNTLEPMPIKQYQIIFENDDDFKVWLEFVNDLRDKYDDTVSSCLVKHVQDIKNEVVVENLEDDSE